MLIEVTVLALCQQLAFCQHFLTGVVQNAETEEVIPFANILNITEGTGTNTNEEGVFQLVLKSLPATLQISSLGYQTDTIVVNDYKGQFILLMPATSDLPMVEVNANRKYEAIGDDLFIPYTFTIWTDYVFLLGKKGTFGAFQVEVFNLDGRLVKKHLLDIGKISSIETNCLGNLYIKNQTLAIQFAYSGTELIPIEKIPTADFERFFSSCKCSTSQFLFFEVQSYNGLQKKYIQVDSETGTLSMIKSIVYKDKLRNYQEDSGMISSGEQISNMGDIGVGENERIRNLQEDSEFLENIFYKNFTDNYLFSVDSQLVLFNFDEKKIDFFGLNNGDHQSVDLLFFTDKKQWKDLVLRDKKTGKFYALQDTNRDYILSQINLQTGQIINQYPLEIKSYEKIEVINDHVFILGIAKDAPDASKKQLLFRRIY